MGQTLMAIATAAMLNFDTLAFRLRAVDTQVRALAAYNHHSPYGPIPTYASTLTRGLRFVRSLVG
jgi:hypothetical protein